MKRDDGFTLIETLVAMAILAVGGVALLTVVESHSTRVAGLSDRVAARWVAENELAALSLRAERQPDWHRAMGVDWQVALAERDLDDTGLREVEVRVAPPGSDPRSASLVRLTGYIDMAEAAR